MILLSLGDPYYSSSVLLGAQFFVFVVAPTMDNNQDTMDNQDRGYKPSLGALLSIEQAASLAKMYEPRRPEPRVKKPRKKSKRPKQLTIKQAFRNMNKPPVNFQGEPLDKCTFAENLQEHVFVHPRYEKAWNKRVKEASYQPAISDSKFCGDCFLKPCAARLLQSKLECDACSLESLMRMTEEEHREKLRFFYRSELHKLQGKKFMNRTIPFNKDIPKCGKDITAKIASAHANGCDSTDDHSNGSSSDSEAEF